VDLSLRHLLDRRLLLFTGKGGVGKSTVVAALAVEAAAQGKRPLIVELGHRATMQGILGAPQIGHEPVPVGPGGKIWAANLDFEESIVDYVVDQVKIRRIARSIVGNSALQSLFRAAPAVREIVTLNKLRLFERAETRGQPTWGPILVDLDATGHALMLLEMPRMIGDLLADGPLRGLIDTLTGLFTDPSRTLLNLVTLPSEIPVQETCELYARLRSEHGVQLGALFVNNVPPPAIRGELRPLLPELVDAARRQGLADLQSDLELAEQSIAEEALVRSLVGRMHRELALPLALLPRLEPDEVGVGGLARLGRAAMVALPAPSSSPVLLDMEERA
jgi:arsenite/tail-anchored protein-transporting ATPase